jgi:aspartate/methionine/tyrosine aminotransferase
VNFPPFAYMEWAKLVPPAAYNLSRSGVGVPSWEELGVDPAGLALYGDHPYGYKPLLEAIAGRAGAEPDHVIIVSGASQAIFLTAAALLEPGDRALVESPAYEPLVSVPRLLGAQVVRVERRFEDGYRLDLDRLAQDFTPRTKLLLLTNLHNPSGVHLERREVEAVAALAARRGAYVFVDEVYLEFLSGPEARSAYGAAENIIAAGSLTKAYGLAGLRCGWIITPPALAALFRHAVDHVFVEHVFLAEQIAAAVFPRLDGLREKRQEAIRPNHARVAEFMAGEPRLEWVEPKDGLIAFPRLRCGLGTGDELARRLREEYRTSVVPGGFFGAPRHFRLGFGATPDVLEKGLTALGRALDGFQTDGDDGP